MFHKRISQLTPVLLPIAALVACMFAFTNANAQASSSPGRSPVATATRQLARGDLEGADQTLWSLLSSSPNDEQAMTLLGIVRSRQRRYLEAESLFRHVVQIDPKAIAGYRNLAGALIAQDKFDEAIAVYQQAETVAPQDINLKLELARLEVARGKFSDAMSTLDTIPAASLPRVALPVKAASLVGVGRAPEAASLIPQAKGSPVLAMDLAEVFLAANLPDEALRALDVAHAGGASSGGAIAPALKRASVRVAYLRGRALQAKGDNTSALASFDRALRLDPNSVQAMLAISELYTSQNKARESLEMLQRARAASHDSAPVLRRFVVAAMTAGQPKAALAVLPDLLQHGQKAPDDLYLAAAVMLADRQYVQAGELLEKYVDQRPQDAKGLMGLGMAYVNQRRYAEARTMLGRSLELEPKLAEAEYQLGVLASKEGKREEAIRHLETAVQEEPGHGKALFDLGNIYLEAGELDKALTALQRSAVADPTNSRTEYDLGLVLTKLGRTEEAKQHLERFRVMEKGHEAQAGRLSNPPQNQ